MTLKSRLRGIAQNIRNVTVVQGSEDPATVVVIEGSGTYEFQADGIPLTTRSIDGGKHIYFPDSRGYDTFSADGDFNLTISDYSDEKEAAEVGVEA